MINWQWNGERKVQWDGIKKTIQFKEEYDQDVKKYLSLLNRHQLKFFICICNVHTY